VTGIAAGRTVIITGVGSGIGKAVAIACAGERAQVADLDISRSAAEETAELIAASDGDAMGIPVDVTDAGGVAEPVQAVERRWVGVHGLFNNAAMALRPRDGPATTLDWPAWERTIAVNLTGAPLMLRHAIPSMIRSGGGSIVNNVSIAALVAEEGLDTYTASKGGLLALIRSVAAAYASEGVRCNAICPDLVRTPLAGAVLPETAGGWRSRPCCRSQNRRPSPLGGLPADRGVPLRHRGGIYN
jgi:NAD(P)-dependent dehydrogenase (short-subunit alcohol dehydrogenase family)